MVKKESGFTLVELMITMVIFVFVIAAASQVFVGLLTQFKQQSKIAETSIEGIVSLEMMRRDIEHAGYGLPWVWTHALLTSANNEAVNNVNTNQNEESYNDLAANAVPRALVSGDSQGGFLDASSGSRSDVLVVKAVNVVPQANGASSKWTHLFFGNIMTEWTPDTERLQASDRVIVIQPATRRLIVDSGGAFSTRYNALTNPDSIIEPALNDFTSTDETETRVVYGVTDPASPVNTALRMPFNRADYYVRTPATIPSWCAAGTGVLYKATLNQPTTGVTAGNFNELPLLDCVADLQVIYRGDFDNNPATADTSQNDISALNTADLIRNQLKEVWVFVLSHEGQRDPNYTFNNFTGSATCATCVRVGHLINLGRDVDLGPGGLNITDFRNYRWKLYTLVVRLTNLR